MTSSTIRRLLPVTSAALEQEVTRLLRKYAGQQEKALLIRAQPLGNGFGTMTVAGQRMRVVSCVSPLAVLEQVTEHAESDDDAVLVVLTGAEDSDLGTGLLSRVIRQRVFVVEPWRLIEESFGAQHLDPRLAAESWAGEALVDAMPPGGWPRLAGPLLTRDTALRALAVRRLGLDRIGVDPENLDASALLLWSRDLEQVEAFRLLREAERAGLIAWLRECAGGTADVLFPLVESGHAGDALALGLVCAALWHPQAGSTAQRAQGGVLSYIAMARPGEIKVTDQAVREFAAAAEQLTGWMLADRRDENAGRHAHAVLDRAEELIAQFGAGSAAQHSLLLRSSLDARIEAVAQTLRTSIHDHCAVGKLAQAVAELREHKLADIHAHRVRRAEMAQRLVQWLATPNPTASGAGAAVQAQMGEWGWVDRARDDIWAGEELNRTLQSDYRDLYALVRDRRRALDEEFAGRLAASTAAGADPGQILMVETVLPRVVAPLVTGGNGHRRPVLLLVLDGMSTAVATALGEELRAERWEEYDPVAGADEEPRRRAVVAALPTVTQVSRASLFAARITTGGPDDERAAFEKHAFWKGKKARLFHKGGLPGDAGETLGDDLVQALNDDATAVAVVLNTIDDSLDKGRADVPWRISDIAGMRTLLDYARYQGRAVIITSDHGHVLERGSELRRADGVRSARHRSAGPPADAAEVELAGSRVAAADERIVALWDPHVRYTDKKAGYHGGASLAEVTIPLLAFLPLGAAAPTGWRALPDQSPSWWSLDAPGPVAPAVQAPARTKPRKNGKKQDQQERPGLFDVAMASPEVPQAPETALVAELLDTELFQAQQRLMPRKVPAAKIEAVLVALLESGGVLPLPVAAERAGEPVVRAAGFAATLQRIFNLDNYPVLAVVDNGRTLKLDVALLREQFGLKGR
ncbi:BREX-2 system phosphatase PglZ [Microbispora sp. NBC_01389]|uniref:BREX-2 system phosphatase PglZ n=1 Tax=Microbispora sp. NBC_01389 TaxID=2903584 RepID=UPI00324F9AE9